MSGPGDVMADGCRPPAGGKCLLETSEEAEPEDRTSPGASAVECVCVCVIGEGLKERSNLWFARE